MNFRDKKYKRHLLCKSLPLLVAGILSLLQLSCTSDVTPMVKDDTATIHVTFGVDKATRALSTNESTVSDITVLVFDSNSNLVGSNYTTFTGAGPYSMTVTARTGNCTIYAIANTGSNSYFKGVATIGDFKKKYDLLSSGDDLTNRGVVLMFGKTTYNITAGATIPSFPLTRLCTKLTFNITPSAGITVTGYRLRSVPTSSYINDDQSQTPSYNPSNNWADCTAVSIGSPVAGVAVPAFTYYMYENLVGTSNTSVDEKSRVNAAPNATYLEVYAKTLNWHSTYRIYLGGTSTTDYTNFNLSRNNAYNIAISITGPGQGDARVTYTSDIILPTGTYLYSDGTSGTYTSSKTAIAVVFSNRIGSEETAKGYHNYAIALKDASTSSTWGSYGTDTSLPNYTTLGADYGDLSSGYVGTYTNGMASNSSSWPAFYAAKSYSVAAPSAIPNSGWYLPTVGQWMDLAANLGGIDISSVKSGGSNVSSTSTSLGSSTNITAINKAFTDAGGTALYSSQYYWSSSECSGNIAGYVRFLSSHFYVFSDGTSKSSAGYVRAVLAF